MKTKLLLLTLFALGITSCYKENKELVDYVNPYLGNISFLLVPTYPITHLPNGMIRVQPQRADYTFDYVDGLPVTKISHRGRSVFKLKPFHQLEGESLIQTQFVYDNEKITPYRYYIYLNEEDVEANFAPSYQSAVYDLKYNNGNGNFILTAANGMFEKVEGAVQGYSLQSGGTRVYIYLETEQEPVRTGILKENSLEYDVNKVEGSDIAIALCFNEDVVKLRYGISFISLEQAKKNLKREINTYNVDEVSKKAKNIWNETLAKIKVKGASDTEKHIFYTSLYRTYERPTNVSEDGNYYSPFDKQVHSDSGRPFYTDDWIWDTYRATHPLRMIIEPEMEQDMINSFILMSQQTPEGWLPTFPSISGDGHGMNGNHVMITIWDAYSKGLRNFDLAVAYKAAKKTAMEKSLLPYSYTTHTPLDKVYLEKGYYPALNPGQEEYIPQVHGREKRQVVSITLADCYDVWAAANIAKELGAHDDYEYFINRSFNYHKVFNRETGFFHARNLEGDFIYPMDQTIGGGKGGRAYYAENNGWVYRWEVPHNIADLVELMGGKERFSKNLDETFRLPIGIFKPDFFFEYPDHTGLTGKFSMGNEPSFLIPYLYNYAGKPWKTQKRIRELLNSWFNNDVLGVPGDEDGGGMTAFVVFSYLGFYPVTPGLPMYVMGSPVFEHAVMDIGNGKTFEVKCHNYSPENKYIQSAKLNGREWNKSWFSHEELMKGGKLELVMGNKYNTAWGASEESIPPSFEMK